MKENMWRAFCFQELEDGTGMAYELGFQHLPRDLANVNAWKTMFDTYITS